MIWSPAGSTALLRKISLCLVIVLLTGLLAGCGSDEDTELMGSYAKSDSVVNYDVGAMKAATFSPLLSQWFICDVTEDMLTKDYVFDEEKEKRTGSVFVMDRTNNKLLLGYNMLADVYPASITKLMTALVILKNCDTKELVTIDETVAAMKRGSNAVLDEGDVITVHNLLIVLLTVSANNAAVALARHLSGTEEEFVKLMNQEMDKLGANNTKFVNSSGLHIKDHKSTPYDLYVIYQECMKYQAFRDIMKLTQGEYEYTNKAGEQRVREYKTTNAFKLGMYKYPDGITILGGKTGTTDYAGYCLILHVKNREGTEYLLGVFHCETEAKLYNKMTELMEQYCK
ncbi:MAG: D-alanyl-D-alanine carboxypeptidase [Lachnospiraceae bacterium]|nr:D-alanyl-D-alanine carboxypeptidase [Lachnospiraceae bacterium]